MMALRSPLYRKWWGGDFLLNLFDFHELTRNIRQDVDFEMSVLFWTRLWSTKREVNGYIFVYKLEGDK